MTPPKTEHTPTPWKVVGPGEGWGRDVAVVPATGDDRAIFHRYAIGNDEANAAFIVRAANAHEALVAALIRADAVIRSYYIGGNPREGADRSCTETAAALTLARTP